MCFSFVSYLANTERSKLKLLILKGLFIVRTWDPSPWMHTGVGLAGSSAGELEGDCVQPAAHGLLHHSIRDERMWLEKAGENMAALTQPGN